VMTTGVRRSRVGVGVRVPGYAQRVEFANHCHGRARSAAANVAFNTRQGETSIVGNAELVQLFTDQTRRVDLLKAWLRMRQDSLGNVDEPGAPRLDKGLCLRLQFCNSGHGITPCKRLPQTYCASATGIGLW